MKFDVIPFPHLLPLFLQLTILSLDYGSAVSVGFLLLAALLWFVVGKKTFFGPKLEGIALETDEKQEKDRAVLQ